MTSYDEVPYPVFSHSQTHPAELATLAVLHGLQPAPVQKCRVLEIGCAQGGNLIPMAYGLPTSEFIGIDLSSLQIADGQKYVEQLGLKNIRLAVVDLMDFDDSFGKFDYIIAHGFYSWVPAPVRERLFEVCQRHLTAQGVAYISYNANPGWRAMLAIREMLLYRVKDVSAPLQRAELARELLQLLTEFATRTRSVSANLSNAYADYVQVMLKSTKKGDEGYFLHDILEETNDPVYFSEFAAQAARHGLQYLTDSDFRASLLNTLPPEVPQQIGAMAKDRIEWEQYCDFLSNRMFRQNLLSHAGFEAKFKLSVEALQTFRFGSTALPEGNVPVEEVAVQKFISHDKASLATDHPFSKAAIHHLISIWPHTSTFADLLKAASQRLKLAATTTDIQMLASNLLNGFTHSDQLIAFTVFEPAFVSHISQRPVASAWARLQARQRTIVTTLRHGRYSLEPYEQFLIQLLDGQHDANALVEELITGPVARGDLTLEKDGQTVSDPVELRSLLRDGVEKTLISFAAAPLLLA
jgi:methyltransferase-like protein/2-polyprenyl-3-methyl-5-hydroxy-6-metoxy-1,4-benzoquinol methylase